MITDQLNRPLKDLRISVTDRCNFRCTYCMPKEIFGARYPFLHPEELLSFEEIKRTVQLFAQYGVTKIRITGGEPLLRPDLPRLIEMIRDIDGIQDIALITNGVLLPKYAMELKEAGVQRLTVSLDSLDDERFMRINGQGIRVETVLKGIEAAEKAGFPLKINMVVQKGVNDQDIIPMAAYFKEKGHILRFIEFMDVGSTNGWNMENVFSKKEIIERIDQVMPLEPIDRNYVGEVASRYRYKGTEDREIGVISSVTDAFCSTCTRARLSANGQIYTCLFASEGTDIRSQLRNGASDEELARIISDIWTHRKDAYSAERKHQSVKSSSAKIEMSYIGG